MRLYRNLYREAKKLAVEANSQLRREEYSLGKEARDRS